MGSWQNTFDKVYEDFDPACTKTEQEIDVEMGKHIDNYLNSQETLMYDHEFVSAAISWLTMNKGRSRFSKYERRLVDEEGFAMKALDHKPSLLSVFNISSANHYNALCIKSVTKAWRSISVVDTTKCSCMIELCDIALNSALSNVKERHQLARQTKFILNYVNSKVLPLAIGAGMPVSAVEEWKLEFEKFRIDRN